MWDTMSSVEGDLKSMVNNMLVNTAGIVVWQKLVMPLVPETQNEYVKILIASGVVTSIEECKALLTRMGFNLNIMQT